MFLKEQAIASYGEEQEHKEAQEADRFAKRVTAMLAAFTKMFGNNWLPAVALDSYDTVLIDGLEIRAVFNRHWRSNDTVDNFQLRGTCPDCGADCYSKNIGNLVDLGRQIENFEAGWPHKCVSATHHPTAGEALLEALQDFIYGLEEA